MAEVEITRKQIVTIDKVDRNEYQDLLFTDKEGQKYKVGNKRAQYFEKIILPSAAVQLSFAKAYGKEYIYRADKVVDLLGVKEEVEVTVEPEERAEKAPRQDLYLTEQQMKNRSMALAYAKDLVSSGVIEPKDWRNYADQFRKYIEGEII